MLRDLFCALIPTAHRLDVRVAAALPMLDTTARQLLAQEALLRWDGPLAIGDIAEELGCTRPAARKIVESLRASERVTIARGARDARSRSVRLTESGQRLLAEEWRLAESELENSFAMFEDDELRALTRAIARLDARTKVLGRQRDARR